MRVNILLVEDDHAIASTIIYALECEHYVVTHCTTGINAEQSWHQENFEVAILDVGLPDQNGFELCRKLKKTHPDKPIMFLTAHSDEIDRIVGLEIGAEDYLCKPFSPRELVLRIKTILRRHTTTVPSEAVSLLQHHADKKHITCAGKILALTKSEYLLLSAFIQHPGRVFTRDNLLDILGDVSGNSGDRAIDTHIKELRTKLRMENNADVIITHRGLGYSLDVSGVSK